MRRPLDVSRALANPLADGLDADLETADPQIPSLDLDASLYRSPPASCAAIFSRLILDYSIFGIPKLDGRATGKIEDAREPRMTDRELEETRELVRQVRSCWRFPATLQFGLR